MFNINILSNIIDVLLTISVLTIIVICFEIIPIIYSGSVLAVLLLLIIVIDTIMTNIKNKGDL